MRPEFLGHLVVGLVASLPSEAMQAVDVVKNLVNTRGIEVGDDYEVPSEGGTCSRWDAIYPLLGLGPDSPVPSNLLEFITKSISTVSDMGAEGRDELALSLENAEWSLAICLDPAFAVLSWFEAWSPDAVGLNKLDPTGVPPPRFARRRVSARWLPIDPVLDSFVTPPKIGGLQRLVSIPFALLVTAAEICIEARRRMSGNDLPNSEPSPGSDGDDEGATASPDTTEAAGPGSHSGLIGQSSILPARCKLANELDIALNGEQSIGEYCHSQHSGACSSDRFLSTP